ncbi:hypothetical protein BCR39DRAFT_561314 [Naematelia encephala]|uniref:Uncharacterized protein n=1 Tax=Naematelia encephala TaxID=71784 RepID=A0A1Y2ARR0_9TREE|nr:hypothetical protein BCR39DRAFT_561314 [Naematelia encephala]
MGIYDPPSPMYTGPSQMSDPGPTSIVIPRRASYRATVNAIAGPSSEGAIPRRGSREDSPSPPRSPSSAPPTPSGAGMTHPPVFIHTHHPRRASMTPLGLNVISPKPPLIGGPSHSPIRSVGFNPSPSSSAYSSLSSARRESATSTSSTLTQIRPSGAGPAAPASGYRELRRSSLTPSIPTLAPLSPTRTHATGRVSSRPRSSDGAGGHLMQPRNHSREGASRSNPLGASPLSGVPGAEFAGRRGSLPQMSFGGWQGPQRTWNPSLPTQRGSVDDDTPQPDEEFKFGSAAAALRNIDRSPGTARRTSYFSSSRKNSIKEDGDVFKQAELEEAERQRRAFLAATYGGDGKRARERLSIGGGMVPGTASPGTPGGRRRQSLMIWEKVHGAQSGKEGSDSMPILTLPTPSTPADDYGRRGSLPVSIPGGGLGRVSSRREQREARENDMDSAPKITHTGEDREDADGESDEEDPEINDDNLFAPVRPLPPLLPLSDPGPRLLPATLAMHRASHLLSSRNLHAELLPHPLPPSLHPPPPVDVTEFDIDFILAGSRAQLGGEKTNKNAPIDVAFKGQPGVPATPTLQLGPAGEDEDTFAKFVGEYDDEYDGRRGDWTFRVCKTISADQPQDPLEKSAPGPKSEWSSFGAGWYEQYDNGDVRSVNTGCIWHITKVSPREYELVEIQRGHAVSSRLHPIPAPRPTVVVPGIRYLLTCKSSHCEHGGVKLAANQNGDWLNPPRSSRSNSYVGAQPPGTRFRVSVSESLATERARTGSADSSATAKSPLAQSLPQSIVTREAPQNRSETDSFDDRGRASLTSPRDSKNALAPSRSRSKDRQEKDKDKDKKTGFGGVFKRALKSTASFAGASDEKKALREEKAREKAQSQSWSPSSSARQREFINPTSRHAYTPGMRSTMPQQVYERNSAPTAAVVSNSSRTSSSTEDRPWLGRLQESEEKVISPVSYLRPDGETYISREGKAWNAVPEEAVAMVVPMEQESPSPPAAPSSEPQRQALLVWYVPFNSEGEDRPPTAASSHSNSSSSRAASEPTASAVSGPSSLPKLQKLLRRRASRDQGVTKRDKDLPFRPTDSEPSTAKPPGVAHPLPFRSFRVVARFVDVEDLISEPDLPVTSFDHWQDHHRRGPMDAAQAASSTSSNPSPLRAQPSLPSTEDMDAVSASTAPTSTIAAGRSFPTVIAVCHSRSQGVEFVLEGLDRLGFCTGESAWGPTGYEEWRGTGLNAKGRELLDLLWAGCTGVMGLTAQ